MFIFFAGFLNIIKLEVKTVGGVLNCLNPSRKAGVNCTSYFFIFASNSFGNFTCDIEEKASKQESSRMKRRACKNIGGKYLLSNITISRRIILMLLRRFSQKLTRPGAELRG